MPLAAKKSRRARGQTAAGDGNDGQAPAAAMGGAGVDDEPPPLEPQAATAAPTAVPAGCEDVFGPTRRPMAATHRRTRRKIRLATSTLSAMKTASQQRATRMLATTCWLILGWTLPSLLPWQSCAQRSSTRRRPQRRRRRRRLPQRLPQRSSGPRTNGSCSSTRAFVHWRSHRPSPSVRPSVRPVRLRPRTDGHTEGTHRHFLGESNLKKRGPDRRADLRPHHTETTKNLIDEYNHNMR